MSSALNYFRVVKSKIHGIYHSHLMGPHVKQDLEYYSGDDPEENRNTSPPEGEFIDLKCLWAVEFYTPAHTDSLVNSFTKLGWDKEESTDGSRNPITWIHGLKRYHRGGAWMNLGLLIPNDAERQILGRHREVPLPPNVEYAQAGIHSLSPSLICIVVCFVFKEEPSGILDEALRADYATYATRTRTGWRYHTPTNQKKDAINQIRTDLSQLASKWFSQNLPGLFSSGLLEGELPTCELMVTSTAVPFGPPNKSEKRPLGYRWLLGIDHSFGIWEYKGDIDLRLSFPSGGEGNPQYHAILAMKESTLEDYLARVPGIKSVQGFLYRLNLVVPNYLSVWAILPMLEGFTRHIREIRDSTAQTPTRRRGSVKTLDILGNHLSYSIDIAAVAAELAPGLDATRQLQGSDGFMPHGEDSEQGESLGRSLSQTIGDHAKWLLRTDESLRDQLTQYGSLLGALESVRVQKKVGFLTWVLVVFTLATVVMSALALTQSVTNHNGDQPKQLGEVRYPSD